MNICEFKKYIKCIFILSKICLNESRIKFHFTNIYLAFQTIDYPCLLLKLLGIIASGWWNCGEPVDILRNIRPAFIRSYQADHLVAHFRVDSLEVRSGSQRDYSLIKLGNKTNP